MATSPTVVPDSFPGSLPEYLTFITLQEFGKVPDVDFFFQSSFQGGRLERGGLVIDFIFADPPDLAINIQGEFFHYLQGQSTIARDVIAREQLAAEGITLIFIDAEDVELDRRFYVSQALNFRDHSRLSRA